MYVEQPIGFVAQRVWLGLSYIGLLMVSSILLALGLENCHIVQIFGIKHSEANRQIIQFLSLFISYIGFIVIPPLENVFT